jgi:transcriptional regulator with XRE-family HTH domain
MSLNSRTDLIKRVRRNPVSRQRFVESHLTKTLAYQIRAMRDRLNWSQGRLAAELDMTQNAISRLESPDYGKATLSTLKRIAAAFDVALVVRFVPFSQMIDWASGTPHVDAGLSGSTLSVPTFTEELSAGRFDLPQQCAQVSRTMRPDTLQGAGFRTAAHHAERTAVPQCAKAMILPSAPPQKMASHLPCHTWSLSQHQGAAQTEARSLAAGARPLNAFMAQSGSPLVLQ